MPEGTDRRESFDEEILESYGCKVLLGRKTPAPLDLLSSSSVRHVTCFGVVELARLVT